MKPRLYHRDGCIPGGIDGSVARKQSMVGAVGVLGSARFARNVYAETPRPAAGAPLNNKVQPLLDQVKVLGAYRQHGSVILSAVEQPGAHKPAAVGNGRVEPGQLKRRCKQKTLPDGVVYRITVIPGLLQPGLFPVRAPNSAPRLPREVDPGGSPQAEEEHHFISLVMPSLSPVW